MAASCPGFVASKPVYLDLVVSPRCMLLTEKLVMESISVVTNLDLSARTAGTQIALSLTSVGTPASSIRVTDVAFLSSACIACVEQAVPESSFSNSSSPLFDYLKCAWTVSWERDDAQQAAYCMNVLPQAVANDVALCVRRPEAFNAAKNFAQSFPSDYLSQMPLLYIDGKRYCGPWAAEAIQASVCQSASNPSPPLRTNRDSFSPVPRVQFEIDQPCPLIERFSGDRGLVCLVLTDRGGVLVELVPVIGLMFLIISAFTLACLLLFKRRTSRRNRAARRQQRTLQVIQNERILDIMQFLALLSAGDEVADINRHKEDVAKSLNALPTKLIDPENKDPPTCTVCLESVDVYYVLDCDHKFHKDCLKAWLDRGKFDCPVCRQRVVFSTTPFSSSSTANNPAGYQEAEQPARQPNAAALLGHHTVTLI